MRPTFDDGSTPQSRCCLDRESEIGSLVRCQPPPEAAARSRCRGMGSDIEMDKSSRAHLQHIHDPKADANRDEEITSQHGLGMIVDEGHPALGWNRLPSAARRLLQQILLDSSR